MIDVYRIGATLVLNDLVSPQLLKLIEQFRKTDALAMSVNSHLAKLDTHVGGIRALSTASRTMATNFGRANSEAAQLARGINAVHAAGLAASRSAFLGHLGGGAPGGGYISGVPQRGGAGVAASGGGGFGGGHGGNVHVGPGGFGMGAVGFGLPASTIAPVAAGAGALYMTKALYDAGKDYETAYARFKTLNLGEAVNKQANDFARGTKVFGASSAQLMETLRESVGMFGDINVAKQVAPTLTALNTANAGLFGGKVGKFDESAVRSIMRYIDMLGMTDSKEDFLKGLDETQRFITGSGGTVQPADLEQFAKRGGTAFKAMSPEGRVMMATMIQEMGGASAGTGLMSAYQNLVAGRTTKKTMAAMQDLGLAKLGYVDHGMVGGKPYKTLQILDMQDKDTLIKNFPLWIMNNVIPALEKRGIKDTAKQAAAVNDILSNRTASNQAVNFTTQSLQTLRDFRTTNRAKGTQGTIDEFKGTAIGAESDFMAAWNSLKVEMSRDILPTVTKILTAGADFFRSVNKWGEDNAGLTARLKDAGTPFSLNPLNGGFVGWGWRAGSAWLSGDPVAPTGKGKSAEVNPVATKEQAPVQVNTTIKLDSRVIAEVITLHQAKELARPLTGPSGFDSSMALRPPSLR